MTEPMTEQHAIEHIRAALGAVAPEFDLDTLEADDDLRDVVALDSLDFLSFVERLSARTGRGIEERDYDRLATLRSTVEFLLAPPG